MTVAFAVVGGAGETGSGGGHPARGFVIFA